MELAPKPWPRESKGLMKSRSNILPQACVALGNLTFDGEPNTSALGATRTTLTKWGISVDGARAFRQTLLGDANIWIQVPPWTVERPDLRTTTGQIASLVFDEGRPALLFSLLAPDGSLTPLSGPFPAGRRPPAVQYPDVPEDEAEFETLEDSLLRRQMMAVDRQLQDLKRRFPYHPRVWFAHGTFAHLQQHARLSRQAFHQAMLLGHPDALAAEWSVTGLLSKAFRARHARAFSLLERGALKEAIAEFQRIAIDEPLHGNATLAYLLRRGGDPLLGVEACKASLAVDPMQSDVYAHLWSFLTALGLDAEARIVAQSRLMQFPQDTAAYYDGLDSSLLIEDYPAAYSFLMGALCNAQNINTALKCLFKFYEATRDWPTLRTHFEEALPALRGPTPETLILYGELLTELGDFAAAHRVLERAVGATPESSDGVLAYARSLARSGQESEAAKFLMTVLGDRNRVDGIEDRLLIIALLSEILSRTGRPREALTLWPPFAEFTPELLARVGPRPFIEFGYCLLQAGETHSLLWLERLVTAQFPEMRIVKEFREIVRRQLAPSSPTQH